jgi:hypothetical protein
MNIVIGVYPQQAGGKFLFNCLGLSNQAYLQDINLVRQQRSGQLTPQNKLNLLIDRLNSVEDTWNDLYLGCRELFGYGSNLNPGQFDPRQFHPEISQLASGDKLFFVVAHTIKTFKILINIWPNAKIIYFDKCEKFIRWRCNRIPSPLSFNSTECNYITQYNPIIWNSDTYLDRENFFVNIKWVYNQLGLDDFNLTLIEPFYDKYINILGKIKNDNNNIKCQ